MSLPADSPRERTSIVKGSTRVHSSRISESSTIAIGPDRVMSAGAIASHVLRVITSPPVYRV